VQDGLGVLLVGKGVRSANALCRTCDQRCLRRTWMSWILGTSLVLVYLDEAVVFTLVAAV
jgi:hypothetical protein